MCFDLEFYVQWAYLGLRIRGYISLRLLLILDSGLSFVVLYSFSSWTCVQLCSDFGFSCSHYDTVEPFDFIDFRIISIFSCQEPFDFVDIQNNSFIFLPSNRYKIRSRTNSMDYKARSYVSIFIVLGLCCLFYILGALEKSGFGKGDRIAEEITELIGAATLSLNFQTHHNEGRKYWTFESKEKLFEPCSAKYIVYMPYHDQKRAMTFS